MKEEKEINFSGALQCPIPKSDYEHVLLAHGGGGTLSHQLISKMFFSHFDNEKLREQHDSAIFNVDKSLDFFIGMPVSVEKILEIFSFSLSNSFNSEICI